MHLMSWRAVTALFLLTLFGAAPARAEWRRAESPNFVVYSTMSESRLRDRIVRLEDFDRLMRTITSVNAPPAETKLHVYIVDSAEALSTIRPMPAGVDGFYAATPDGIAAVVNGRADAGNQILFHEYAHHFMWQYAPNAYPGWYIEGFAEYFMTVRFTPRKIDIGNFSPGRAYSIAEGQWLPMDRILFGDLGGLNADAMAQYYAQAWLTVHYFYSSPERQAALRRYLAAARAGDPQAALQAATGMDVGAFTAELRRYIRDGQIQYRQMNRTSAEAPPAVTVTTLPRSADDLILYEAALRIGIGADNRQPYLERIRAAAARHPGDPLAGRVLAHVELLHGDGAAADRLLDSLLAAEPANAEYLYLRGLRHLTAAETADDPGPGRRMAREWFTRAHRADENHFPTLYRFAQSMRGERDYVSENTVNILLLAHQLAPQVAEITMNTAMMLIGRRRVVEAAVMLRPLAADPHNEALAGAARRMLAEAMGGRPGDPTPPREGADGETGRD